MYKYEYIYSSKMFEALTLFSLYLKLWESVTLPNVEKNVWNNTEIMYGYVETNTQISECTRQLIWKLPKFTFFPKFCNMLEKFIMFIEKTL